MEIAGARIYDDGVGIKQDAEVKIKKIVDEIKADELPIGIYTRGMSLSTVLDTIHSKVERECIKVKKAQFAKTVMKMHRRKDLPMEMAG